MFKRQATGTFRSNAERFQPDRPGESVRFFYLKMENYCSGAIYRTEENRDA